MKIIIIKKFKINGTLVKNEDNNSDNNNNDDENNSEDCNENVYGKYISNDHKLEFNHQLGGNVALHDLDCESNENLNYFQTDYSSFMQGLYFEYGSSFKYEIILNGNSVNFSDKNFKKNK